MTDTQFIPVHIDASDYEGRVNPLAMMNGGRCADCGHKIGKIGRTVVAHYAMDPDGRTGKCVLCFNPDLPDLRVRYYEPDEALWVFDPIYCQDPCDDYCHGGHWRWVQADTFQEIRSLSDITEDELPSPNTGDVDEDAWWWVQTPDGKHWALQSFDVETAR